MSINSMGKLDEGQNGSASLKDSIPTPKTLKRWVSNGVINGKL